jgi:hypothetical protein
MKNLVKFTDRIEGQASIASNKDKYFKTKDSTSPSGHALVAQIEMTHSGIVTRNYGFYLPSKMRDGAFSFTKDYAKPVIIGHDEDPHKPADPVGRVIQADYVDTSSKYASKDSYFAKLSAFVDAKDVKRNKITDFVNHVIENYDGKDGYKGLGHIRGTLKITDAETIGKILDERYLTVSTSMSSNSAVCSICATDWVQDGACEHSRGGRYDDSVMVLVPGAMSYDHLGIVNAPADPNAAGFKIIGAHQVKDKLDDSITLYEYKDNFTVAASLFAWNDKNLYSLSTKEDVDLIEVKDNIQKMENAMAKKKETKDLRQNILDGIRVSTSVYSYSEESGSKEMTISQYAESLSEVDLEKLITDITAVMAESEMVESDSADEIITKYFDDKFKLFKKGEDKEEKDPKADKKPSEKKAKKKAKKMDSYKLVDGDEISDEVIEEKIALIKSIDGFSATDEEIESLAVTAALIDAKDPLTVLHFGDNFEASAVVAAVQKRANAAELSGLSEEAFTDMLNAHMPEGIVHSNEGLRASDFCGVKGFFPVTDKNTYIASKAVLAEVKASDSVKGRILGAIEKKLAKLAIDLTDSFDRDNEPCDNTIAVSTDDLLKAFEDAKQKLVEVGYEFPVEVSQDSVQEISILEAQLEAANEEVETISAELVEVKDALATELATRLVQLKVLSGNFEVADEKLSVEEHKTRSIVSLKDSIKDLSSQVDLTRFKINDGLEKKDIDASIQVENPVMQESEKKSNKSKDSTKKSDEFSKEKVYDQYRYYVSIYGKKDADQWLDKVMKKNGLKPSLD